MVRSPVLSVWPLVRPTDRPTDRPDAACYVIWRNEAETYGRLTMAPDYTHTTIHHTKMRALAVTFVDQMKKNIGIFNGVEEFVYILMWHQRRSGRQSRSLGRPDFVCSNLARVATDAS